MITISNNIKIIEKWLDNITDQEITTVWHNGSFHFVAELHHTRDWISITAEPVDELGEGIRILEVRYIEE